MAIDLRPAGIHRSRFDTLERSREVVDGWISFLFAVRLAVASGFGAAPRLGYILTDINVLVALFG